MHPINTTTRLQETVMNTFGTRRRQTLSPRSPVLVLVMAVDTGIAGFIDRLASAGPSTAVTAVAQPAAGEVRG
jgi:hypothetical protein